MGKNISATQSLSVSLCSPSLVDGEFISTSELVSQLLDWLVPLQIIEVYQIQSTIWILHSIMKTNSRFKTW